MNAIQIPIGQTFPIHLMFVLDGSVVLKYFGSNVVFEHTAGGIDYIVTDKELRLYEPGNGEPRLYEYEKAYKLSDAPVLKQWLIQQALVNPFV